MQEAWICTLCLAIGGALAGCSPGPTPQAIAQTSAKVPHPVDLLLPKQIRIHAFTAVRTFPEYGNAQGIEARIEAIDAYEDNTKAFGEFRFELYSYKPIALDHKGELLDKWTVDLMDPQVNMEHWDSITRTYIFKLQLTKEVKPNQSLVLRVVYQSPYTKRLFAEQTIGGK